MGVRVCMAAAVSPAEEEEEEDEEERHFSNFSNSLLF